MKVSECFSISQECWNLVICFIILNSIYFNIYRYSAKGEEQGRNTENIDICQLFTPFPLLPWACSSCAWGGAGGWAHSYCAGGPWTPTVQEDHGGSCLILVQRSHLKLVGFQVSFPVFFLLLFSLVYSAVGFLSFLSRSGGYFVPSSRNMYACMYVSICVSTYVIPVQYPFWVRPLRSRTTFPSGQICC